MIGLEDWGNKGSREWRIGDRGDGGQSGMETWKVEGLVDWGHCRLA